MADRNDDAGSDDNGAADPVVPEVKARPSGAGLPQPGDVVAERYRVEREIGHGGMAVVYAATQLSGGNRQVALKWLFEGRALRDERRRRFLREARVASAIAHRNVVRVYDAGEHKDGVYLVMELVAGESLTAYLQRGKLSPSDAVDLLMSAFRGITAAHKQGVVHRDLKPDNLFVCTARDNAKPEIKVLDFGLSKLIGPAVDSLHTLPGTLVGTPHYMAPEQADGRLGAVSERSDVYTLATILYEAVAGRRPFESETLAGQLMKVAHEAATPLDEVADVPQEFADTVMWALARDPAERPRSIEDFALELERFGTVGFADNGRMSTNKGSQRPPRKPSERAPAPATAAASAAPPPAQAGPVRARQARSRGAWLIVGALAIVALAVLAYRQTHAPSASDAAPTAVANAPVETTKPAPVAAPLEPAPASPASQPAVLGDAGAAPSKVPPSGGVGDDATPEALSTKARGARPAVEPARQAPAPPALPTLPAERPAPDAPQRAKRSPGVADPWDELPAQE